MILLGYSGARGTLIYEKNLIFSFLATGVESLTIPYCTIYGKYGIHFTASISVGITSGGLPSQATRHGSAIYGCILTITLNLCLFSEYLHCFSAPPPVPHINSAQTKRDLPLRVLESKAKATKEGWYRNFREIFIS